MNTTIQLLQKRQSLVLRIRNCIVRACDKDAMILDVRIARADKLLSVIGDRLKMEYSKLYKK